MGEVKKCDSTKPKLLVVSYFQLAKEISERRTLLLTLTFEPMISSKDMDKYRGQWLDDLQNESFECLGASKTVQNLYMQLVLGMHSECTDL